MLLSTACLRRAREVTLVIAFVCLHVMKPDVMRPVKSVVAWQSSNDDVAEDMEVEDKHRPQKRPALCGLHTPVSYSKPLFVLRQFLLCGVCLTSVGFVELADRPARALYLLE